MVQHVSCVGGACYVGNSNAEGIINHTFLHTFFLNFYVSILLELELSLAQFLYPAYFKSSLDLGIK